MTNHEVEGRPSADAWGRRFAYAAATWAFGHAALTLYWALGGTAGLGLLSEGIQREAAAREPYFIALLWAVVGLKVAAGGVALALVRPEAQRAPRWLRLASAWAAGLAMTGYAVLGIGLGALASFGVLPSAGEPDPAFIWYLVLWYPLWLLGGLLFLAAAWRATARGGTERARSQRSSPSPRRLERG